jgi:hypothetical protein
MVSRNLLTLTVLTCTDALEFGKSYERYQASQASASDEATAPGWRAGPVREASAAEE